MTVRPDLAVSCEEPAIAKVWWDDYDRDSMLVCPEHFEVVKRQEREAVDVLIDGYAENGWGGD